MSGIGEYDRIIARRTALVANMSPAAKHANFPRVYARPVPLPNTTDEALAEIKALTAERALLVAEVFRLKAENDALRNRPAAPIDVPSFIPTLRGFAQVADLMKLAMIVAGISFDQLKSASRSRTVAWPRHLAIWLVREIRWDLSLPQIGQAFGRDHTTIMNALKNVEKYRDRSPFKGWIEDPRIQGALAAEKAKGEPT